MKKLLIPILSLISTLALGVTVKQSVSLTSFNAGELSPLMQSRIDFAKYKTGAKTLQNMIVRAQGPVTRRPGTKYIATVKDATDAVRVIPFEYSTDDAYIIELGDAYARFYRSVSGVSGPILSGDDPYEITTPWDSNDLRELQYVQDAETMRFSHPDYEPYKLTRTGHTSWTCVAIDSTTGPFLDENTYTDLTITPSGTGFGEGNDYYITGATGSAFNYGAVYKCQTFTASDSYTSSGVKLQLRKIGAPGTVTITLKATTGGKPTGDALATGTTDGNSLPTDGTGEWRQIEWASNFSIVDETVYAIIVNITNGDILNAILWRMDGASPTYAGGSYGSSSDSGANWTMNTAADFMFNVVVYSEIADANSNLIDLAATGSIFEDDHVGALFQISHSLEAESVTKAFWTNGDSNSTTITVQKYRYYDVITAGSWKGTFKIQRSYDSGSTWEDVYGITYAYNGNIQYAGQELEKTCLYRMAMRDQYVTSHNFRHYEAVCDANFNARGFINNGVVEIFTVTDPCNATAYVKQELGGTTATWRWAEGAWSDYRGWPRTIEHHEQRVIYGGSASYPQTIWSSIIATNDDDYDDFTANTESDSTGNLGGPDDVAWTYTLPGMNPIQWMRSAEYLMVGTTSGVGKLGQPDKPITPNFPPTYRVQNHNGCAYIQPKGAVDALLYVERGNQKVRELAFAYANDKYVAPDMTILAEHITGDGIVEIDFQDRPDPILWCVREDGVLLSFTYHRKHDVLAWSRQVTDGEYDSIAKMPGTTEDELWAVVDRDVGTYIEQFQPLNWGTDQNDCYFVDCGIDDVDDLSHLEGGTVALFADGRPINTFVVSDGSIDPDDETLTEFTVGLPYTSIFETVPLIAFTNNGESLGKSTRVLSLTADFLETLGCHIGTSSTYNADIKFSDDSFATTVDAFTGIKPIPFTRNSSLSPTIYLTESDPVPLTLRGYNVDLETTFD